MVRHGGGLQNLGWKSPYSKSAINLATIACLGSLEWSSAKILANTTNADNLPPIPLANLLHKMTDVRSAKFRAPCRNFASKGTCPFRNHCRYFHNMDWRETRPPPKLTPCFHWENAGACPYGYRCAYLHKPQALDSADFLRDNLLDELYQFAAVKSLAPRESIMLAELRQVASYDWMVAESPTIGIPGKPWTRPLYGHG
jgi:hypothetical protein